MKVIFLWTIVWGIFLGMSAAEAVTLPNLRTVYKMEWQIHPESSDFVVLKETRDDQGPIYFMSYRRGANIMRSIVLTAKRYAAWRDALRAIVLRRNPANVCVHKLSVIEEGNSPRLHQLCFHDKKTQLKMSGTVNSMISHYRKSTGWSK